MPFLVDENGKYNTEVGANVADISKYPPTYQVVYLSPTSNTDWWDGVKWNSIGKPPFDYAKFDYATKEWVDGRNLTDVVNQMTAQLTAQRNNLEYGTLKISDEPEQIIAGGAVDQQRIMFAAIFASTAVISDVKTGDVIELTVEEAKRVSGLFLARSTQAAQRYSEAMKKLKSATTAAEAAAVTF